MKIARGSSSEPGFDLDESPLTRLGMRRGKDGHAFLGEAEMMAGERLRADFTRAGLTPSVTQRWNASPRDGGSGRGAGDLSDNAIDAKARVDAAMSAVGPELSGVLLDVCCFLKGLETVERERQWPVRSGKMLLKAGLGVLARHYGYAAIAADGAGGAATGAGRIRRWGAADYRPSVGGSGKA